MRCPSAKKLTASFKLTRDQANLIRKLAHAAADGEVLRDLIDKSCPDTRAYVASMHSSPYRSHMWRVTVALHAIDRVVGGYGVEAIGPVSFNSPPPFEYVNMGDTYATTLIYKRATDNLFVGDWGSIVEREDRRGEW